MFTDKDTGKELTLEEAIEKVKLMTDEEKLDLLDLINKQLGIQPLKSKVI